MSDVPKTGNEGQARLCLTTRSGKGKELCDLLRRELGLPETVRWFEVRFCMEEPVSVKCDYLPRA